MSGFGRLDCANSSAPGPSELLDCYMSASLTSKAGPALAWQHELHRALAKPWREYYARANPKVHKNAAVAAATAAAASQRRALQRVFSTVRRWHLTTQERLFGHLRAFWSDNRPRVMMDLGCHAGHGRFSNTSDALIWMDWFKDSGSAVLGVDAFEDFALDLQERFDTAPYSQLASVEKHAVTVALSETDGSFKDMLHSVAKVSISCCAGKSAKRPWCNFEQYEPMHANHHCRITRQRLGLSSSMLRLPPSSHPAQLFPAVASANISALGGLGYPVLTARADTLWQRLLRGQTIDFLKVDVDTAWHRIGLEGLIARRGFRVMSIEVDSSWHAHSWHKRWGISVSDWLVWATRLHGYDSFMKVPCHASTRMVGDRKISFDAGWAAWLFPMANQSSPFAPSGATLDTLRNVHDMLIIDAKDPGLVEAIVNAGRASCRGATKKAVRCYSKGSCLRN